ncbi:hypothetical protein E2C01_034520 [Portunus trituberculatus]|uniref:Uncharacterized protein n=1 Tax=Portunus trituberculatus TaxID=210409 RepID=A0A5B7F796_PORTR|nr:hypothetical protein [Portunus trituberculatus]
MPNAAYFHSAGGVSTANPQIPPRRALHLVTLVAFPSHSRPVPTPLQRYDSHLKIHVMGSLFCRVPDEQDTCAAFLAERINSYECNNFSVIAITFVKETRLDPPLLTHRRGKTFESRKLVAPIVSPLPKVSQLHDLSAITSMINNTLTSQHFHRGHCRV